MSAINAALDALNDQLVATDSLCGAFELCGGESAPPWVDVFCRQFEAIRAASEALEQLIRRGYGGNIPHGDAAADHSESLPRGSEVDQSTACPACLDQQGVQ